MCKKIETVNHDGSILKIEVSFEVWKFDKKNYWQEDWRNRKSKNENSYEQMCEYYQKSGLPEELIGLSSENKYIRKYEIEQLHKAINELPELQRRRIILRYFDNLSLKEIAEIENCDISSVRTLIHRGLENLKKYVEKFF